MPYAAISAGFNRLWIGFSEYEETDGRTKQHYEINDNRLYSPATAGRHDNTELLSVARNDHSTSTRQVEKGLQWQSARQLGFREVCHWRNQDDCASGRAGKDRSYVVYGLLHG